MGASSSPVLSSSSIHAFEENPLSENIALIPSNSHQKKNVNEDGSKDKREMINKNEGENDVNVIFPNDLGTFRTTTTESSIVYDTTPIVTTSSTSPKTSFVQKKVQKIINKIITIAQIKNAIENSFRDHHNEQYPHYNPDEVDSDGPNVSMYTRRPNFADLTRTKIAIKIEKKPEEEYGAPVKFNLQPSVYENNKNENTALEKEPEPLLDDNENVSSGSGDRSGPAALGIFVLEMFASLVGLTFGAAAQINNSLGQLNNTV